MVSRKIKIWIDNKIDCKLLYVNDTYEKIYKIKKSHEHNYIIAPINSSKIKLLCLQGKFAIGNIELNYSTKINSYYEKNYSDELSTFLEKGADLSLCSNNFYSDLQRKDIFVSTGKNNFSAIRNLKNTVTLNGNLLQSTDNWYSLVEKDELIINVFLSPPFVNKQKISVIIL